MRTIRGRIDYVTDGRGVEGREWFEITVQPDGQRTLRARCEIDDHGIHRDVTYTIDAAWRPLDAFVRVSQQGRFVGSGWFCFGETGAECEAQTAEFGRISQRWPTKGRPPVFVTHAVITDVWQIALFDHQRPERVQTIKGRLSPSPMHNGASGPMLGQGYSGDGRPGEVDLQFVGPETLTVPAGTFETGHYSILRAGRPPLEIWGSGPDIIPVQLRWDLTKRTYQLAELSTD